MPFRSPGRTQPDRRLPCQKMHMLWFGSNHSDAASRGTEKILQCLWFSSTRSPCDGGATCRDSHKFGFPSRPIWKRWFVPRLRRRLRPLCQSASGLDWKVVLFDFDQGALEFASNQLSISKTTSDLSSLVDDSFDVIWAYHVAEHWRSIDDSFNDLDRLIKPGGKLVIATPNARSWEKYLRPAHFKYYYQAWRNRGLSPVNALKLLLSYDSVFAGILHGTSTPTPRKACIASVRGEDIPQNSGSGLTPIPTLNPPLYHRISRQTLPLAESATAKTSMDIGSGCCPCPVGIGATLISDF